MSNYCDIALAHLGVKTLCADCPFLKVCYQIIWDDAIDKLMPKIFKSMARMIEIKKREMKK